MTCVLKIVPGRGGRQDIFQGGSDMAMEPFRNVSDIQGEVNRLFATFLGRPMAPAAPATRSWLPAVDMHETKDDLVLTVDVPGVCEKDVNVAITGDLLTIRGERRWDEDAKSQQYLHAERV